jgi:hypothetical protein
MSQVDDSAREYSHLDAPGTWSGGTTRDRQVPLGRLTSNDVLPGMSGAPVRPPVRRSRGRRGLSPLQQRRRLAGALHLDRPHREPANPARRPHRLGSHRPAPTRRSSRPDHGCLRVDRSAHRPEPGRLRAPRRRTPRPHRRHPGRSPRASPRHRDLPVRHRRRRHRPGVPPPSRRTGRRVLPSRTGSRRTGKGAAPRRKRARTAPHRHRSTRPRLAALGGATRAPHLPPTRPAPADHGLPQGLRPRRPPRPRPPPNRGSNRRPTPRRRPHPRLRTRAPQRPSRSQGRPPRRGRCQGSSVRDHRRHPSRPGRSAGTRAAFVLPRRPRRSGIGGRRRHGAHGYRRAIRRRVHPTRPDATGPVSRRLLHRHSGT